MIKLSDTQLIVLSAAAQRDNHLALPLPPNLKGGAAHKVIKPLIEKGLLREVKANRKLIDPVWRETGDGHGVTLVITDAGFTAIDIEVETQNPKSQKPDPKLASTGRKMRDGTKQAMMVELLKRPEGATLEELVAATGWQSHTIRGAMAGALKKKLGLEVVSEKFEGRGRVYSIR